MAMISAKLALTRIVAILDDFHEQNRFVPPSDLGDGNAARYKDIADGHELTYTSRGLGSHARIQIERRQSFVDEE